MCTTSCDRCVSCNGGTPLCNTQQSFCTGSLERGQLASSYIGSPNAPSVAKDDIIIKKMPQATFNQLISWLNQASNYGNTKGGSTCNIGAEGGQFVTGAKVQEIINGMKGIFNGNDPGMTAAKDKVIYASDFNNLFNKLNQLQLHPGSCNQCVSGCNVPCNSCNQCNTCQACNVCLGCDSCDSCEGCDSWDA